MTLPTAFGISLKLWTNTCMPTHTPVHYQTHRNTVSVSCPQTIRHPNKQTIRHTISVRHMCCQTHKLSDTHTHYQTHKHQCQTHTHTFTHYQTPTNTHTHTNTVNVRHPQTHYQTHAHTLSDTHPDTPHTHTLSDIQTWSVSNSHPHTIRQSVHLWVVC